MTNRRAITALFGRVSASRRSIFALTALVGAAAAMPAFAQNGEPAPDAQAAVRAAATPGTGGAPAATKDSNASLLGDFIFYTRVRNYDIAASKGRELLNRGLKNSDIVSLVEKDRDTQTRFADAVQQSLLNQASQSVAGDLDKAYQKGLTERARDAAQITRNIQELGGNARTQMLAQQRLIEAGEYAMPQLFPAFLDRNKPALQPRVQIVIRALGRQAIMPLCAALPKLPPADQERVADLLGLIQWRTSVPFLSDLAQTTKVDAVRDAANRSIQALGGAQGDVGTQYRNLAEQFYNEKSELTSFPGEDFQLLWDYQPGGGLTPIAIRTPVYHEAVAMGLLERALTVETGSGGANPQTVALWVASNFSREIDSPKDYQNPAYAANRRSAMYYAVASGADVSQRVLARALDARDTPLARRSLEAVEQTAGRRSLFSSNGRTPLLEALTYPSRRVQYEAALALASAQPQEAFAGSDRVVPVLASSIRGASARYAAIVTTEPENYQTIRGMLTSQGYTVLPQGRSFGDLAQPIAESPAVDLIVVSELNGDRIPDVINQARGANKTTATPLLVLTNNQSYNTLRLRYATDSAIAIRPMGTGDEALNKTLADLMNAAVGGPVTEQEARTYAQRSLAALRDLSLSTNNVLNVADATVPLVSVLNDPASPDRMLVAQILSRIGQERAQRAVLEAALSAKGPDRVALLGNATDSAKRYGNMLDLRETSQVVNLASTAPDAEATAAAALMGALNLPSTDVAPLIFQKK